jgi:DNA-directed RNA polymerase subunit beta'
MNKKILNNWPVFSKRKELEKYRKEWIIKQNEFIQIQLASPETIKNWSLTQFENGKDFGYITSTETIDYKTLKPVFDGLFCERIFGPIKDWECHCGRVRYYSAPRRATWCPYCWVQITRSNKRRSKLGIICLSAPILHIWYARSTKTINPLFRLLFLLNKDINKISQEDYMIVAESSIITPCTASGLIFTYFEWQMILSFFRGCPKVFFDDLTAPWKEEVEFINESVDFLNFIFLSNTSTYGLYTLLKRVNLAEFAKYATKRIKLLRTTELLLRKAQVIDTMAFYNIGRVERLEELYENVQEETVKTFQIKHTLLSGLTLSRKSFLRNARPEWIFFSHLPVLPPDLRPIFQVENGGFASSDLNDLYRFLLFRTNRLKELIEYQVQHIVILRETELIQSSVNAILDNTALQFPVQRSVMYEVFEPMRSLSDRIVGKTGRFRQNILGKRVDYSGRSVIIVGPTLRLWECGLPKEMAFVLFRSFLIYELMKLKLTTSVSMSKMFIALYPLTTIKILRHMIVSHPVLLNRAPTLHRMGIQAFFPKLVNGRAIQLHPFVCPAFNADFDGDQMAVHIPLSQSSILEARLLLLAPNNWLSPANGEPSLLPSQDIVLGIYYLTLAKHSYVPKEPLAYKKKIHSLVWLQNKMNHESQSSFSINNSFSHRIPFHENNKPEICFITQSGISYTIYPSSITITDTFGKLKQSYFVTTTGRSLFHKYLPINTL